MPPRTRVSGRLARLMLLLASFGICAGTAWSQDKTVASSQGDLERRIQELEKTVQQLKADPTRDSAPPAPAPTASAEIPTPGPTSGPSRGAGPGRGINLERQRLGEDAGSSPSRGLPAGQVAGWNNGFYLQSPDQRFVFRITGQIQSDYRGYLNDNDTTDIDTFLLRRARFGLEATIFENYEFRFLPDFGQGQARIQDAYLNVHYWDAFQFEAGKFKQPFSYEQLVQDRYVPTLERSLIDQLAPARDVGVMVHGQNLLGNHFDYALALSNGQINGDGDVNNNKDLDGRVALRPFAGTPEDWLLRYLEVGVSGGFGEQNAPIQPATLSTPLAVRWFQFNSTVRAQGLRSRWSPELSYFLGPLGVAAQYFHQDQEMLANSTGPGARSRVDVPADGFYVLSTLLLTGESRTGYSQAIAPQRPFDPCSPFANPGAWELVGRVSRLNLGDGVFTPGPTRLADPTRSANAATEMTLGFNWYFNRFVRMQFNWERSWFDRPVQLGAGSVSLLGRQDALGARFQIIF